MEASELTPQVMMECYRDMLKIRLVEETVTHLFMKGEIPGFIHVCIGQEAAPVAVCKQLRPEDWVVSTHRGHGHVLAKGIELKTFMAELLGRKSGCCGGRGGSMHLANREKGIFMANGIVGAGIPLGTGLAFGAMYKSRDEVTVVFFGEGASNQGVFYESLAIAALMKLPVVFVCENNKWAQFTRSDRVTVSSVTKRAEALGVPSVSVANDFESIWMEARRALIRARSGDGPGLLEVECYRWEGHYVGDSQKYRDKEDIENARKHDCVKEFAELLKKKKLIDDDWLEKTREDILEEIKAAVEYAKNSEVPDPSTLLNEVYIG